MGNNNYLLCGLMGAGKTTVGRLLAKKRNLTFVDLDVEIEQREAMSISEIFLEKGENYFRRCEEEVLAQLCEQENQVIALGGGTLGSQKNRELLTPLKPSCFYLKASVDSLWARLQNEIEKRPLLFRQNPGVRKSYLAELLQQREQYYQSVGQALETDGLTSEQVVERVEEFIA